MEGYCIDTGSSRTWRYPIESLLISSTKFDFDLKSMQYAIPCGQEIRDITLHLIPGYVNSH